MYFNSQPHKEADMLTDVFVQTVDYFNSQPHKEADNVNALGNIQPKISTHSLTRRLTYHHAPQ